jgi:acyl-CoA dehydrogenase
MNFDFSEDQRRLQEEMRRLLTERSTSTEVRRVLEGEQPYSSDTWMQLAQLGALGIAIPEEFAGTGLGALELCLLAEEAGRTLAAVPLLSSVYLAAEVLRRAGREAQKTAHLPAIAAGERLFACQLEQPVESTADQAGLVFDQGMLSGTVDALADGMVAHYGIFRANESLLLVNLDADGIERTPRQSVDPARPLARLRFADVPAELVGDGRGHPAIASTVVQGAAILLAFEQLGGAEAALYAARDYVLERKTFGRVVGSYQGVKHTLAELFSALEMARAHAWYGAWALSSGAAELPTAAAAARVAASEAYNRIAEESLHLHGGIGFTWEMDCHLHLRRARWLGQIIGTRHLWRDRLAAGLMGEAA